MDASRMQESSRFSRHVLSIGLRSCNENFAAAGEPGRMQEERGRRQAAAIREAVPKYGGILGDSIAERQGFLPAIENLDSHPGESRFEESRGLVEEAGLPPEILVDLFRIPKLKNRYANKLFQIKILSVFNFRVRFKAEVEKTPRKVVLLRH